MNQCGLQKGFAFGGPLEEILPREHLTLSAKENSVDEYWMRQALSESLKSGGYSNPNPGVGCVIVKDGVEIGRGHTQPYGGRHAEAEALIKLKGKLAGATVYVTLEPCSHHGHQPPCVEALAQSAVERVVIGCVDLNPKVNGAGIKRLQQAGKKVTVGILKSEITAWLYPFLFSQVSGEPLFTLKWAQTLDGQMADDAGKSKWISGSTSRLYTHWLRQKYDVIMVGSGTALKDFPHLTARYDQKSNKQPLKVIYDPNGRMLEAKPNIVSQLSETTFAGNAPVFIIIDDEQKAHALERIFSNARCLVIKELRLKEKLLLALEHPLIRAYHGKPIQSVFVEGGPTFLSMLIDLSCASVIHTFISPKITGGSSYRLNLNRSLAESGEFQMLTSESLGEDTLVELVNRDMWGKIQNMGRSA